MVSTSVVMQALRLPLERRLPAGLPWRPLQAASLCMRRRNSVTVLPQQPHTFRHTQLRLYVLEDTAVSLSIRAACHGGPRALPSAVGTCVGLFFILTVTKYRSACILGHSDHFDHIHEYHHVQPRPIGGGPTHVSVPSSRLHSNL